MSQSQSQRGADKCILSAAIDRFIAEHTDGVRKAGGFYARDVYADIVDGKGCVFIDVRGRDACRAGSKAETRKPDLIWNNEAGDFVPVRIAKYPTRAAAEADLAAVVAHYNAYLVPDAAAAALKRTKTAAALADAFKRLFGYGVDAYSSHVPVKKGGTHFGQTFAKAAARAERAAEREMAREADVRAALKAAGITDPRKIAKALAARKAERAK